MISIPGPGEVNNFLKSPNGSFQKLPTKRISFAQGRILHLGINHMVQSWPGCWIAGAEVQPKGSLLKTQTSLANLGPGQL